LEIAVTPYHYIVGFDFAGVVVAVGPKVTRFKVGDEVFGDKGNVQSAFAEYCVCDESNAALKPKSLSFLEAASMPLTALTSLQALRDHGRVGRGSVVVIRGASGGTGAVALQIAKHLGASSIIAISSQVDLCMRLGATEVSGGWGLEHHMRRRPGYQLQNHVLAANAAWSADRRVL
jgi:alcohol dehydrogenase